MYSDGSHFASPVHSPGWPSPRVTESGFMQLPLPPTPTSRDTAGDSAYGKTFATMPPVPPSLGPANGDAVGVAWLSETKPPAKVQERTAAATATTDGHTGGSAVAGETAAASG